MLGEQMEREIREQPHVLARGAASYAEQLAPLEDKSFDLVVLAARGSSDNAALYARYLIEIHLRIPVVLAAPSVITRYGADVRYPRCLGIGISQSGEAPDVAEVLEHLRGQGHATLAITNTPGSRLTRAAEHSLLLEAGEERSVAATKTYTASLLALYETVRAIGSAGMPPASTEAGAPIPHPSGRLSSDAWCDSARAAAEQHVAPLLDASVLFGLARGYGFATAHETALKLMECALLPCKAYSLADFEHGPKALATHGSAAIVFGAAPPYLAEQGCHAVQAPETNAGPLSPIWDAIFGQWLALLAARARGLDPDDPQHLKKVTKTL